MINKNTVQQFGIKYYIFPPTNFATRGDPWFLLGVWFSLVCVIFS